MITHKKNTAYYLSFPMVDSATPETFKSGVSPVDTAYYKDGAGAWTSLAITDAATEIASTGVYEIDLTAAEMNHDYVFIKFAVAGAADTAYLFKMHANSVDDLATAANLATVDTVVDAIKAVTDLLPNGGALTSIASGADLAVVDANVDAIKLVTDALPDSGALTSLATAAALATVDANVDSILIDTGTDIPALIGALNDAGPNEILYTAMTEGYAAVGAQPTLAQAIYLILQRLVEFDINGTTLTVKRLNGTTTAGVMTLDDADEPKQSARTS